VILSFTKIGVIGFGGGAALIPIIESELVEKNKWMDRDNFSVAVATASISPASIPVSICAIWNLKYSLFSAYFYALPGSIIFMILLTGFTMIGEAGVKYIENASAGILIFVLLCIYNFIKKNLASGNSIGTKKKHIIVFIASFVLYSGNSVRNLITSLVAFDEGTLPSALFALSMLDLIAMLFFIVCFIGGSKSRVKIAISFFVAGIYTISSGRIQILGTLSFPLLVLMLFMAVASILFDIFISINSKSKVKIVINHKPLINVLLYLAVAVSLTFLTYFISKDTGALDFAIRGITSSLSSFGGGEVYYTIADEVFVQTGFISEDIYLSRILGIAGAMPGPVIVSILAGIGFSYGNHLNGAALGWLFGLLGASMAITATALGASLLYTVFELLKDSLRLRMIIDNIIPMVCGVLLSVALTLLTRASHVISSVSIQPTISFIVVVLIFLTMLLMHTKYRVNSIFLFLLGGTLTLIGLGLISNYL